MNNNLSVPQRSVSSIFKRIQVRRGMAWGVMILAALLAFELFNYSTTEFALTDVLGDLRFVGIRWATILAVAFCVIDFAGIARLFTPEQGRDEPAEVWYLFGAWLLAAAMNALLTWWGVSVAIANHSSLANGSVVNSNTLTKVVPVFVAIMVWLIRVLIIGTFSIAGERIFSQDDSVRIRSLPRPAASRSRPRTTSRPATQPFQPAPKAARSSSPFAQRPEPTYQKMTYNARSAREAEYVDDGRR